MKYIYKIYYKLFPREMVSWWKTKEAVKAKLTTAKDGSYIMWMEGEKYPFPGWPRGHLLYGTFSKLKHEIKVQLFNNNWWRLEAGEPIEVEEALENIYQLADESKNNILPIEKCAPVIRELHQVIPHKTWRDIICYILQEDDAYRFRFQWMSRYLDKKDPIGSFEKAMTMLEHAEVTEDMKDRVRLIKRILLELWKDPYYAQFWIAFVHRLNKKKVKLSKADKFYFRAKYFKVDYPYFEY